MRRPISFSILVCLVLAFFPGGIRAKGELSPARWEKDIQAFEASDKTNAPATGAILFLGSSNMRRWTTLAQDFPEHKVINRAFGGSHLSDSVFYFDRIVTPYKPKLIVIYAGSNDINSGKTPEMVLAEFKELVAKTRKALPETRIAFISITVGPKRWEQLEKVRAANKLIEEYIKTDSKLALINLFPHLLGEDGKPLPDIFIKDNLHMNANGYAIWKEVVGRFLGENVQLPSLEEVLEAKTDLWGLAAMRQPNGASYEFFEKLLPPLRYVNAEFKYYPIVLSAPGATNKVRLVSNGSAINARANLKTWKEAGVPVKFSVGEDQRQFGEDFKKLKGPTYERGYLPIVQLSYQHEGKVFEQESFASAQSPLAEHGVAFVRFTLVTGVVGHVTAQINSRDEFIQNDGAISKTNGIVIWFDRTWKWNAAAKTLNASLSRGESATLAIAVAPFTQQPPPSALNYQTQRKKCVEFWEKLLERAAQFEVPESIVNNAWRSTVIGSLMLRKGDNLNYSAGNQYERLYEAECGDTLRSLVMFGRGAEMRALLVPLLDYTRTNGNYSLKFHQAAFKLQMLAHYYWLTRDASVMRDFRSRWQREANVLIDGRDAATGLLPKEQYAGDIFTRVVSLNSNANGWRGLRDIAAVLAEIGERAEAERIFLAAKDFRKAVLAAVEKSEFHTTTPPFIPLGLFGEEQPYDRLTESKMSSYYNEMASYIIGSGVFGVNAERETWMMNYLQEHGGIAMGMIRFHQHSGLFANEDGVDDLYSLRYTEKLFQRDDVDRALVSFYGKLAQGFTRDTFICAEGTSFKPLDEFGRPMYCPPNSTGNAFFLWMLRDMLVQDWDMNDDGKPETLRLLFATPKRWLEDGKEIKMERAPTAFGEVAIKVKSSLSKGEVTAEIDLPKRNRPEQTLLRIRVPDGWRVVSAQVKGKKLKVDEKGTVDISELKGKVSIRSIVQKH